MKCSFAWMMMCLALGGVAVTGCGSASEATTSSPTQASDTLSDSASALSANDTEATFDALDRCTSDRDHGGRGRDRDSDAGVDEDQGRDHDRDRGPGRNGTGGNANSGNNGGKGNKGGDLAATIARGLEQLLTVADLDALKECQELAQDCATKDDRKACSAEVEACVKPVLTDAFSTLCAERIAACKKNPDDKECKRVEQACGALSSAGTGTKP